MLSRYLPTIRRIVTRRNIVIVILLLIGLRLFFSIYDGVQEQDDFATFDQPLLSWVVANQYPPLVTTMQIVTDVLSPISLSVLVVVGSIFWVWRTKDKWRPALLIGAMTLAFTLSAVIKELTARARPSVMDLLGTQLTSYSFPSGHTIGVATLLFVLGYLACDARPTVRRILSWAVIAVSGVVLIAFTRIYLGYHWLTDVTASVGLAFAILALVIAIDTYKLRRDKRATTSSTSGADTDQ